MTTMRFLTEAMVDKLRQLKRSIRWVEQKSRLKSLRLFLYWSLRNAGESDIESMVELSGSNDSSDVRPTTEVFCVANGLYPRSAACASRIPNHLRTYETFEAVVQAQGGIRERMDLLESENRKDLKVEASVLQNRLVVLTFVLFIVPFATLLSASYLVPEDSPFLAAFFIIHPLISFLTAKWATVRDDTLAS